MSRRATSSSSSTSARSTRSSSRGGSASRRSTARSIPSTCRSTQHPRAGAARDHPLGRAVVGLRRRARRACRPGALRARRARSSASATACSSRRSCSGGKVVAGRAARVRPRHRAGHASRGELFHGFARRRGARRSGCRTATASRRCRPASRVVGESAELPGGGGRRAGAQVLGRAVPPRGGAHAARRRDPRQLPVPHLPAARRAGRWPASSTRRWRRSRAQVGPNAGASSAASRAASTRRWRRRWSMRAIGDAAHLHLRRQRPAARGRARRRSRRSSATPSRPTCAWSTPSERFLGALAGVTDPEQKRKIIGREFIAVFEEEAQEASAAPTSWRRARSTRRHRDRSRSRGRRRRSRPTTTWAACPSG